MEKNYHIVLSTRQLLLAAVIFVSAAAIITGTILNTERTTTITASAEAKTTKTTPKEKTTTTNANEKEKSFTTPSGSSLPLPTQSSTTTTTTTTTSKKSNSDLVTTQGALSSESALASTDIVNSVSTTYEVLFTTETTATIGKVLVTFPSGFGVSGAKGLEVSGMGSSNSISLTTVSGQTITFVINSPVSVSVGTKIRIEVGNIKNPINAASNYQVSVTTKRSDDTTIDGPTTSSAFSIRKIGSATISDNSISTSMIKDGAVTGSKIGSQQVNTANLAFGSVTSDNIKDGAVTGSKISGTSKLLFVQCGLSSSNLVGPGNSISIACNNPSVVDGDDVVATQHGETGCFDLEGAEGINGAIQFDFQNECSQTGSFSFTIVSAIVFKHT